VPKRLDGVGEGHFMYLLKIIKQEGKEWRTNWLDNSPAWFSMLGILALLFYALTRMIMPNLGHDFEKALIVLGFLGWLVYCRDFNRAGIFWLLCTAMVIPLLSWACMHIDFPQWAEASPKVHRLTQWFIFIAVAFFLGGRVKNILFLWGITLIGLSLAPCISGGGLSELSYGFNGGRIDFGLHNAQHAAILYATSFIGLIVFSPRILSGSKRYLYLKFMLWFFALLGCTFAVFVTQTRGVWLGISFWGMTFLILHLVVSRNKYTTVISIVSGVLFLCLAVVIFNGSIISRVKTEHKLIIKTFEGDIQQDKLPYTSVGIRLYTWIESLSWIKKRPLVGWGGEGKKLVISECAKKSKGPFSKVKMFGHLHNTYLDILVSFGFFGLVLYFWMLVWFIKKTINTWKDGSIPQDFLIFFLSFIVFWLVVNCFESYMFFSSGRFIFSIVFGGMFTLILNHNKLLTHERVYGEG